MYTEAEAEYIFDSCLPQETIFIPAYSVYAAEVQIRYPMFITPGDNGSIYTFPSNTEKDHFAH